MESCTFNGLTDSIDTSNRQHGCLTLGYPALNVRVNTSCLAVHKSLTVSDTFALFFDEALVTFKAAYMSAIDLYKPAFIHNLYSF